MEKKLLLFCLLILSVTAVQANELWDKQMKAIQKISKNTKESSNSKPQGRAIGLPIFDIAFEHTPKATSVHALRPQDIDIIGAMGDSLTAANGAGADTAPGIAIEYRSICFSVGGKYTLQESITLPNILKHFNPKIDGYSYENGPLVRDYPYGFNVAVPGARAKNMLAQAEDLINKLKTDNRTKYDTDWKLITLFIGGNDLCAIGRDEEGATPEVYVDEIRKALDLLHDEVPRMFVNLVDIMEIYVLPYVGYGEGATEVCREMQSSFCGYVVGTLDDEAEEQRLRQINKQYQFQLQDLIDTGRYDTRDDFTVVIQPFLRDTHLPYVEGGAAVDASYFAPDCFHFSDKGHAMSATNLWNNMLEPVGAKTTYWEIVDLKVPTKEHPYFFTRKNSEIIEVTDEDEAPVWAIVVISVLAFTTAALTFAMIWICVRKPETQKSQQHSTVYENEDVRIGKI